MSFTTKNIYDAFTYASQRSKLETIKVIHEKYPHLGSHVIYSVSAADFEDDYYFPLHFKNRAIMVEASIGKKLCEKISCNFATLTGNCTPESQPHKYRIGDQNKFERACQPACFNLTNNKTFNDDGEEMPQMSRLIYHNENCIFVPTISLWAELPLFRSTERFETRINDLPTGFNELPNKFNASGIGYNYNKPYCDAFFDSFDSKKEICYTKWYEQILNIVIGEQIIKYSKAGITSIKNNGNTVPNPNLPKPPEIEKEFLLPNWLNDINLNFVIPNPDANLDEFKNIISKKKKSVDKLNDLKLSIKTYKKSINDISVTQQRELEEGFRAKYIPAFQFERNVKKISEFNEDEQSNWLNQIRDIFLALLEDFVTDPLFIGSLAVDYILDKLLSLLKQNAKKIIELSIPRITNLLLKIGKPVGSRVLNFAIKCTINNVITKVAIKLVGTLVVALARIVALASSVIGIVLIIVSLFDIVLAFWDPLGFNNKYPPGYINEVMTQADAALRQQFQMTRPRIEFESLSTIMLTQDEILEININSFIFILEYLDALEVNSEGARIDKGEEIEFDILPEEIEADLNETLAKLKIYTPTEFLQFEEKQINRWKLSKSLQRIGLILIVASCIILLLDCHFISILFFFIAFFILFLSLYNLEIDLILDSLNQNTLDILFKYTRV